MWHGGTHTRCTISRHMEHGTRGRWELPMKVGGPVKVVARKLIKAEAGAKAGEVIRCDHLCSGTVVDLHCPKSESHLQAEKDGIGPIVAQDRL